MDGRELTKMADKLVQVGGIEAVTLGGSRARGTHTAGSDVDLGLYYRPPLDVDALDGLAKALAGPHATATAPGDWGPWVDGGAWLVVDGVAVDWIYRDLDRVNRSWQDAQQGRYAWHAQVGHPFGLADFTYIAELAVSVVLGDPHGQVRPLRAAAARMPTALAEPLVSKSLWEARFDVGIAAKATSRGDCVYVAGCLFHALVLCAYAIAARHRVWLTTEKGAVDVAARLVAAPEAFAGRCREVLALVAVDLDAAVHAAETLVTDTRRALQSSS